MKPYDFLKLSMIFYAIFFCANVSAKKYAPWVGVNFKGTACLDNRQTYGPYNYTNPTHRRKNLPIVERYHFTPNIQRFKKGKTGRLIDDIAYTLRAFPNHYKALGVLTYYKVLFQLDIKKKRRHDIFPAVECYFQRAFNFVPKDANVHMLYATYLKKIKRFADAEKHYLKAISINSENLRYHYIYGEFLFKRKKFILAKEQADIVYDGNYPRQTLKEKLIKAGHWK